MFFFGITMYTYGIATYFIPLILLILSIYFLNTKKVTIKDFLICVIIYTLISFPLLLMYFINALSLNTIKIVCISIPYLSEFKRMSDILIFSNNIPLQLCKNILGLLKILVFQFDGFYQNAIPFFGTVYPIGIIFFIVGINYLIKINKNSKENEIGIKLLFIWILIAVGIGILVKDVTVYKVNIIWYPIIMVISFGIYEFCEKYKGKDKHIYIIVWVMYLLFTVVFLILFNVVYVEQINKNFLFDAGLIDAVKHIENTNSDRVLVADYNTYNFFERTKVFIRAATNYNIEEYNNEKTDEFDIQYTEKYRIISYNNIYNYDISEYSVCIVPNNYTLKNYFLAKNYKPTIYRNYIVFEK